MSPERILIVGGGIAGLSLATALRRSGLEPEIIEQAPAFGAVGAGIVLGPNAMRMMREIGLAQPARERGLLLGEAVIADASDQVLGRSSRGGSGASASGRDESSRLSPFRVSLIAPALDKMPQCQAAISPDAGL